MSQATAALAGKVAVITGAGRGIGKAIALAYAQAGANIVCAARSTVQIEQTVREIEARGGSSIAVSTDVTQFSQVLALFAAADAHFGRVDLVVINAGTNEDRRAIEQSSETLWKQTVEVNLIGAYHTAKAAIPYLRRQGAGKIITIGSGVGRRAKAELSAYACSKAALAMLTRVLAIELAPDNISVNELIPGPVVTDLTKELAGKSKHVFGIEGEWIKQPEDVVPLALFLACQPDRGPTAQTFSLMRRDN